MRIALSQMSELQLKSWAMLHEVSAWVVSERFRQLNALLAKYSADQPRVPAGNPDGGQWTSGSGSGAGGIVPEHSRGNETRTPGIIPDFGGDNGGMVTEEFPRSTGRITTPPFMPQQSPAAPARHNPRTALAEGLGNVVQQGINAVGQLASGIQDALSGLLQFSVPNDAGVIPDQVNIFIGGADDEGGDFGSHPVLKSYALTRGVTGYNYYATHDEEEKVSAFIQKLPNNTQINMIGHSWGGDTAAKVVKANPGRVSVLVTIDPASQSSRISSDYNVVRNNVGAWININAAGKPGTGLFGASQTRLDNIVAWVGNSWDKAPKPFADMYVDAPHNHADFDGMMRYDIGGGVTVQKILNRRR